MVSEPPRRSSYASAVSGAGNATPTTHASTPITQSPIRPVPEAIPQRNMDFQSQKSFDVEEEENPLILGANDNPCTILVSPPLAGSSNHNTWCSLTSINSIALCSSAWILDSGATNHIVCSMDFLTNCRSVNEVEVKLATGQHISVRNIGDVKLSNSLWLKNAMHIPEF
ncbi:hypothetical protein, partial [Morganella morganii]|uniref:hypothetical protein n=1 Tax=Morganella morganii TaxID=582 RepID=UPI003D7E1787